MSSRSPALRRHVLVFALLVSGLVLLCVGGILFIHHLGQARARLAASLQSTARIIAGNASAALAFRDSAAAAEILASLRHDPLIVSAVLYDLQGTPFVSHGRPLPEPTPLDPDSAVLVDVRNQGETYGRLLVVADNRAELRRTVLTWAGVYGAAFVLTLVVALILAARFQRAVAEPISSLARTAQDVTTRRDYSLRAEPRGPAEVAALAAAFNTMLLEVGRRDETLARQLVALDQEVRERKAAQETLRENTRDMLRLSREAGMAEVASGVLHNIGNALNSINVSAELLADHLRDRTRAGLESLHALFRSPPPKAAAVFSAHPDGDDLRAYASACADHTSLHLGRAEEELAALRAGVGHLKEIVARQQTLAKAPRRSETFDLAEVVQEALLIDKTESHAPAVRVVLGADTPPPHHVFADRAAVAQILINLLANARAAVAAAAPPEPLIRIQIGPPAANHLALSVIDNGVGIPADLLVSIFRFGFTTKSSGHGFGLHNAANTARLLGGALRVHSDGPGRGATFTLELPRQPPGIPHDA
jgi:C4-dicarboxylate-specific signal transduction histidine kinase